MNINKKTYYNVFTKSIIFIIILNFLFLPFFVEECNAEKNNRLNVGGQGSGNYSYIQDAIDNSSFNDTIFVFSGIYNESIYINRSINLIGQNKNSTIIQSNKSLYNIYITSPMVKIINLTIKKGKMGIYISDKNNSYNEIYGNIFIDNSEGIRIFGSSYNNIVNNYFFRNSDYSIIFYESKNNIINNNFVNDNPRGFYFFRWSNFNSLSKNNFTKNNLCIYLDHSNNNFIINNSFREGDRGIYIINSKNNNISYNSINFFNRNGIEITDLEENYIFLNNFSENYIDIKEIEKPPTLKAPGLQFVFLIIAIFIIFSLKSKK